jgi:predicted dienelactone hydrolase
VTSAVVRHAKTQQIQVWAPAAKGHWPVVYGVPGIGGTRQDFNRVGPAVARQGVVFFATDYRAQGLGQQYTADLVCGYRFARSIASRFGGSLRLPVTLVGYSHGAYLAFGALQARLYGPGGSYHRCYRGTPLPNIIIAVDGCYYEYKNLRFPFPTQLFTDKRARITLLSGTRDTVCESWQTRKAANALQAAGLRTTIVPIPNANHYQPMFHDLVNGNVVNRPGSKLGNTTVQTILHAIHSYKHA